MSAATSKGPLSGVRVVDLSTSYAGPTATMYLGDMGADVVKVERPETGDDARYWGPPFVGGEAAWFLSANRNKRSVCLDISREEGFAALMRLLDGADVFVENLNPGKLKSRDLDPEAICARFPRLIYCALSGFGLDGPSGPGVNVRTCRMRSSPRQQANQRSSVPSPWRRRVSSIRGRSGWSVTSPSWTSPQPVSPSRST